MKIIKFVRRYNELLFLFSLGKIKIKNKINKKTKTTTKKKKKKKKNNNNNNNKLAKV